MKIYENMESPSLNRSRRLRIREMVGGTVSVFEKRLGDCREEDFNLETLEPQNPDT
jgi:hypothetical protein